MSLKYDQFFGRLSAVIKFWFSSYKESLAIHRRKPELNHGTKASKELTIFQ